MWGKNCVNVKAYSNSTSTHSKMLDPRDLIILAKPLDEKSITFAEAFPIELIKFSPLAVEGVLIPLPLSLPFKLTKTVYARVVSYLAWADDQCESIQQKSNSSKSLHNIVPKTKVEFS